MPQLTPSQREALKSGLLAEREELMELAASIEKSSRPVQLDQNKVGRLSRLDALQGQALAQASATRNRQRLSDIDTALERCNSPDFGRCFACDEWIAYGRLALDPAVEKCVACSSRDQQG